jgi:hypothetical protein
MIDLKRHIASIVAESDHQLEWAEPEHWVRSELFQRLKLEEAQSGFIPLAIEVPYYTHVRSTGKENDAGPPYGKWIDLLVVDKDLKNWQWIELKVIHAVNHKTDLGALKPFTHDTASLLGFSLDWTLSGWKKPLVGMKLKKADRFLDRAVKHIQEAKHYFASVLLLLRSGDDKGLSVHQNGILENVKSRIHARGWTEYETPPTSFETSVEDAGRSRCGIAGKLIIAKWTQTRYVR